MLGYPNLSLYNRLGFFSYWIIISFCIINISLSHYYHFILLLKWHIHIADDLENTTNKQTKKTSKITGPFNPELSIANILLYFFSGF